MSRTLRYLLWAMGLVCVAIGLFHLALGIDSVAWLALADEQARTEPAPTPWEPRART